MAYDPWATDVDGAVPLPQAPAVPAAPAVDPYATNDPAAKKRQEYAFQKAMAEANARGPGYGVAADGMGGYTVVVTDQNAVREASLAASNPIAQPVIPTDPMANRPSAPLTPQQAVSQYGANVGAFEGAVNQGAFGAQRAVTTNRPATASFDGGGVGGNAPTAEQQPASVDRARIDALLGNVSKATSGIMSLGQRDLEFSQAQAQLRQGLDQGQRQALSLARSGSRRDRAGNEARAIQAGTELAAQTGQAAAGLRAQEEAAQQQIRLDAYKAAGDLGLNAGALDLNAQSLDMNAATNFLNQLFGRENLQLQLDQQEAERVTNFVRDMALLSRDYTSLSLQEKQSVRDDLTRRYGIGETTRVALEQLEQAGDVNWEKIGADMLSGAVIGAVGVGTKALIGG